MSAQIELFTYISRAVANCLYCIITITWASLCIYQRLRTIAHDHSAVQAFGYLATAAACICLIVLWVQAFVHDQTGHIIVSISPHKREFAHRASTFGPPLPVLGIRGRLVLAKPDNYACNLDNITEAHAAASNGPMPGDNVSENVDSFEWPPWELPILLVSRGGTILDVHGNEARTCTFVDKVRIAQAAGYRAVVVYNDRHNTLGSTRKQRWIYRMTADEDENTSDIIIPSVFTSALDGQIMVNLLKNPPPVILQTLTQERVYAADDPNSSTKLFSQHPPNLRSTAYTSADYAGSPARPQPDWYNPTASLHATVHPADFNDPGVAALVVLGALGMALALGSIVAITALPLFEVRGRTHSEDRRQWVSMSRSLRYFGTRGPMGHGTLTSSEAEALEVLSPRRLDGSTPYSSQNALCAICLDPIYSTHPSSPPPQNTTKSSCSSRLALLPCGHVFHGDCSREWLTKFNGTCPLCKLPAVHHGGMPVGSQRAMPPLRRDIFVPLGWQPIENVSSSQRPIQNASSSRRAAEESPLLDTPLDSTTTTLATAETSYGSDGVI